MNKTFQQFNIYAAAVKRLYMWNLLSKKLNLVLVPEFPKSGGTWFCKMFSDASKLPFPQNTSPKFESSIMHGHHLFHPRMNKAIAVLRDGRDVTVSAYFHFLFEGKGKPSHMVGSLRKQLGFENYDDVVANMPKFIEYIFTDYANKNVFHFSWSEFVFNINKHKESVCMIKYEDLLKDPQECLVKSLSFYGFPVPPKDILDEIIDKYSFAKVAKRKQGEEDRNNFVRKGISGDWKNYFNEEACEVFKHYGGAALVAAGYEMDQEWNNPQANELQS